MNNFHQASVSPIPSKHNHLQDAKINGYFMVFTYFTDLSAAIDTLITSFLKDCLHLASKTSLSLGHPHSPLPACQHTLLLFSLHTPDLFAQLWHHFSSKTASLGILSSFTTLNVTFVLRFLKVYIQPQSLP